MKDLGFVLATLFLIVLFSSMWKARQAEVPIPLDAYQRAQLRYQEAHSIHKGRKDHRVPAGAAGEKRPPGETEITPSPGAEGKDPGAR